MGTIIGVLTIILRLIQITVLVTFLGALAAVYYEKKSKIRNSGRK